MSDAVAHTLDGCEVQPLGEELNPEREELLVDMDVVRERGLEIINTTAYIAITGTGCEKEVLKKEYRLLLLRFPVLTRRLLLFCSSLRCFFQALSPSPCMRTSFAPYATECPKARLASRGGSACPAQR